ncbi:MAG: hypothetical protein K0R50_2122 [Eubacterium sp.]|nr:hypothetical protein [Eubacterium sp.]
MYKVLVVDDEEFIIKSLVMGTDWKSCGFEVMDSARDGVEAYEKICEMKPHIVFTDIRMPGMSGLELIKNVQAVHKDILFVVISGYAEFAYARKALDYGAVGYCLKPFDDEEIVKVLKKAANILKNTDKSNMYDVISLLEEETPEARQGLDSYFKEHGISEGDRLAIIASVGGKELVFESKQYIKIKTGSNKNIYIGRKDYFSSIGDTIGIVHEGVKGIGICEGVYSAFSMRKYIDEALTLSYQFFVTGTRKLYGSINLNNTDLETQIAKYENALIKMDLNELVKELDNIYSMSKNEKLSIKHAMNIYNDYVKLSNRNLGEDCYEEYVYSFDDLCYLFIDMYSMIEYIKEKITGFMGLNTNVLTDEVRNEYFKKIINHINQNFFNDISIKSLAQDFVINPNYISQLFRKELGMTFTDYITKMRMNYAKELLQKTEYSQGEIAAKCGYSDYFYFIRVFKKTTGVTPGQYRHKEK